MKHRLSVQARIRAVDGFGETSTDWQEFCRVWGSIQPISGREVYAAGVNNKEVTHLIEMRHPQGRVPTADDRIMLGCRVFDIRSIINWDERNQRLLVSVTELLTRG